MTATAESALQSTPDPNQARIVAAGVSKNFAGRRRIIDVLRKRPGDQVQALKHIDLSIGNAEIVGLVGGSGSGKSTLGSCLLRSLDVSAGRIVFDGQDITEVHGRHLKPFRRQAQMVFQDPYGSLNPRLTVAQIVREPLTVHRIGDEGERSRRVAQALDTVRLPSETYAHRRPKDLSGGQRQRVAIARAVVLEPRFIVADEPVSMLDVSVQAGVLALLAQLRETLEASILYISHDVATVRYLCDRIVVMHHGAIVEEGPTESVISDPQHPYTRQLMAAVPSVDPEAHWVPGATPEDGVTPHPGCDGVAHWIEGRDGHRWTCTAGGV